MKHLVFTIVLCGCFFTLKPYISEAPKPPRDMSVKGIISYHAKEQGVNENKLLALSFCESSFTYNAIGDGGKAYGAFQYHKPTFDRYARLMGETLDYKSTEDQARLTAWIMKNHPSEMKAWTCSKKVGIL